ncbi:MAG: DUF4166 domain-containing protein [Pseudomonadota bacterium]
MSNKDHRVCIQSNLFKRVLNEEFEALPDALQALHSVSGKHIWRGRVRIERGRGWLSRLAGWVARFPPTGCDVPVEVVMTRIGETEVWRRQFGTHGLKSVLRVASRDGQPVMTEQFGLFRFELGLRVEDERLHYPVERGAFLSIPLPRFLLPVSQSFEHVDEQGRACFDVSVSVPLAGFVAHYQGWLEAV